MGVYTLVIVESPAKAKTISKFLGSGYHVEPCQGHVRDLPRSTLGIDIEQGFTPRYITIRGRGPILSKIRKEAKGAEKVLLATDPDREGEAISWHLSSILGLDPSQNCRVEFFEITKEAVKEAILKPRPLNMQRVDAQQARRVVDRVVGYSISPLLWQKVKKGLSAGRVQSVANRMLADREEEIDSFVPEESWTLDLSFSLADKGEVKKEKAPITATLFRDAGEKVEMKTEKDALAYEEKAQSVAWSVQSVQHSTRKKNPPAPFTTSRLEQEAVRKLGFTTAKTMLIAQQLYEGVDVQGHGTVGLISYIRTDSTRLSQEALNSARTYIAQHYGKDFLPETPNIYAKNKTNVQDAHEAIRPTNTAMLPSLIKESVTSDQYKLYKLIFDRYLSSQMTPALYDSCTVVFQGGSLQCRASGSTVLHPGFTILYQEGSDTPEEKAVALPGFKEGQKLLLHSTQKEQHFTQPPPRYTEASLIQQMEDMGIGRPSTYAPTIATIIARAYAVREKRQLVPTELGMLVNDMMEEYFSRVVDYQFTADMESQLDDVEEKGVRWTQVLEQFYPPFKAELDEATEKIEKIEVKDEESDEICELCGARMVYKLGRYGKFLACPNFPDCRNTKPIIHTIETPCPKCGAQLVEKSSRRGRKFYGCSRYPDCDFVSWDMPVPDKCPQCGSYMVKRFDRKKGTNVLICANEHCRARVECEQEE